MSPETGVFAGGGEGCRTKGASSSETFVRFWPWECAEDKARAREMRGNFIPSFSPKARHVRKRSGLQMVLEDKLQVPFQTSGVSSEVILFNFTF